MGVYFCYEHYFSFVTSANYRHSSMKPKVFYNIVNRILDAMYSEKCALIFFEQLRQKRIYLIKIFGV